MTSLPFKAFIIFLAGILSFSASSVLAQGAKETGQNEQLGNYLMGGKSAATGTVLMTKSCGWPFPATCPMGLSCGVMCLIGGGLIAEGVLNVALGRSRKDSIDPLKQGNGPTGGVSCAQDASDPFCIHTPPPGGTTGGASENSADGNYGTNPNGKLDVNPKITPEYLKTLPPPVAELLKQAQDTATKYGLDLNNPASVAAFKARAAKAGLNGADGGIPAGASLPPDLQAEIDKINNNFAQKMGASTSDVGFDEGGGRGSAFGRHGGHGSDSSNLNSLLDGLKDKNREPAAIDGLQKNYNGDAIGVAADDIFKQVSRRYQKKIDSKTFNPNPK